MARGEKSQIVREFAAEHGVCERTAWRWFAAMYAADSTELLELIESDRRCPVCQQPLPEQATIRRVYCDGTCRQVAFRDRKAA